MTTADLPLFLFAACNVLRIAAYLPQMILLARRPEAAASFSHLTWTLFAMANLSTALYAAVAFGDTIVCVVHAFSAFCCIALMALAIWSRRRLPALRAVPQPQALGSGRHGQRPAALS